jgi:ketosteroid isomerase-like protein
MRTVHPTLVILAGLAVANGCGVPRPRATADSSAADATARQGHEAYTAAINSNNLGSLLAVCTEDVVFLSPNEPVVVGKAAVRAWGAAYLKAYTIHWDKAVSEFVVAGDWAFERYTYKERDTPSGGGAAVTDTGKGLLVYHHDADGKWRVARDGWNSDLPRPAT